MKKFIPTLIFIFAVIVTANAQQLMKTVYIKSGAVTQNPKEAEWLIAIRKVNGLYQRNDYKMNGPLKKVKTFKDINQTILEGNYLEYNDNGYLILAGYYVNNKKSGRWFHYDENGKIFKTEKFEGKSVFDDSSRFIKKAASDSLIKPVFKKGGNDWKLYLRENINWEAIYPSLNHEEIQVTFTISQSGDIINIIFNTSSSFHFDNEVIKVLDKAPIWNAASFGGKAIDYHYRQQITALNF